MEKINILGETITLTKDDIIEGITIEILLKMKYGFGYSENYKYDDSCRICEDSMKDKAVLTTSCSHSYHLECLLLSIMEYNLFKCPLCSKEYKLKN